MTSENRAKGYHTTRPLLARLESEYEKLAERRGINFYSLLAVVSPDDFMDGVHPNPAGHQQIAKSLKAYLAHEN